MALGIADAFAEAFAEAFADAFADVFVSGAGNGVIRALFAHGDADAALRLSDASGVDEAAGEP